MVVVCPETRVGVGKSRGCDPTGVRFVGRCDVRKTAEVAVADAISVFI